MVDQVSFHALQYFEPEKGLIKLRGDETMYSSDNAGSLSFRNRPANPLQNTGEDSAASSGNKPDNTLSKSERSAAPDSGVPVPLPELDENVPVTLPELGDGFPVTLPEFGDGFPVTLPEFDESRPVDPGPGVPIIPLPDIGSGRPISPDRPGVILPVRPQPNPPCYYCGNAQSTKVRFLNAAVGYRPFRVYVNNRFVVNGLGYASMTPYGRVALGFQTITVTGMNGYVYLQIAMPFRANENVTMAIINTPAGIDLLQISDTSCSRPLSMSCFRVCNLASNTNPLDVILSDGRVVFSDVRFKEVTAFRRAKPGQYEFYLAETNLRPMPRFMDIETINGNTATFDFPKAFVSFYVDIGRNATYTVYILSGSTTSDSVQTLVVEDR